MKILIELHDRDDPILNILSCLVIRPELVVFISDEKLHRQRFQRPLRKVMQMAGLETELEFVHLELTEIDAAKEGLTAILDKYGDGECILDVSGGNDLLLMAAGMCCQQRRLALVSHRVGSNRMRWLWGPQKGQEQSYNVQLGVAQVIAMAGGEMLRHGHIVRSDLDDMFRETINAIFGVYAANRQKWPQFVQYLQQTDDFSGIGGDPLRICAPKCIYCNGHGLHLDLKILSELADVGAIEDIRINSSQCAFRFGSEKIQKYLCDVGIWLELYLHANMADSGLFDAVEASVVVSWDDTDEDQDTVNEIDLIATAGVGRLFISCKTAVPDNAALNEISTLTRRFGGRYAIPVLATMCDLKQDSPAVFRRAAEMGIAIIDADDLGRETLKKKLASLRQRWDQQS